MADVLPFADALSLIPFQMAGDASRRRAVGICLVGVSLPYVVTRCTQSLQVTGNYGAVLVVLNIWSLLCLRRHVSLSFQMMRVCDAVAVVYKMVAMLYLILL